MKGLAFAYDPDGYSIEIIKRGGIEFGDKKFEVWIERESYQINSKTHLLPYFKKIEIL